METTTKTFLLRHNLTRLTDNWERDYSELDSYLDLRGNRPEVESVTDLKAEITMSEINKTINDAKSGKAVVFENVPNEVLKLKALAPLLHILFRVCFEYNIVPTLWYKTIIQPILKKGEDPADPLGHRGINLMSTVAKLFNGINNSRIVRFLDIN